MTISINAQFYNGKYHYLKKDGVPIDSVALVTWPEVLPQKALIDITDFQPTTKTDRVGAKFVIPLMRTLDPRNRSHVAVYYAPLKSMIGSAELFRWGLGTHQIKMPVEQPGYYYAVALNRKQSFVRLYYYDGRHVYHQANKISQVVYNL